jgi:hypothetical protein
VGYDKDYITCITWGAVKRMTWRFWAQCADECYAILGKDWHGHFGGGDLDLDALNHDLQIVSA